MPSFIVLHIPKSPSRPGVDVDLEQRLASIGDAHLQLDHVWLVHSREMADDIRDRLSTAVPAEDAIVVLEIAEQAAWRGVTEEQGEWLVRYVWVGNRFESRQFISLPMGEISPARLGAMRPLPVADAPARRGRSWRPTSPS
jgi:hypothetical protein